jgi:hypothetical protein
MEDVVSEGSAMEDVVSDITSSLAYASVEIEPKRATSKRVSEGPAMEDVVSDITSSLAYASG